MELGAVHTRPTHTTVTASARATPFARATDAGVTVRALGPPRLAFRYRDYTPKSNTRNHIAGTNCTANACSVGVGVGVLHHDHLHWQWVIESVSWDSG
eukprot:2161386-Rhodomonas_salina.1